MLYKITNNLVDKQRHFFYTQLHDPLEAATTSIYKYLIFPRSIQEWKHLLSHVVNSPTLDTFRNRIINHYLPNPGPLPYPNTFPHPNPYPNPVLVS